MNCTKTIILINGSPFLVELDKDGKVIQNYLIVADYFESDHTHTELIKLAEEKYAVEEAANLNRSRMVIFHDESTILNDVAIDNIRHISQSYHIGDLQNINITAGYLENMEDEITTADRIKAISNLLMDFGVEEGDISANMKIFKSDIPNQFVKIELLR